MAVWLSRRIVLTQSRDDPCLADTQAHVLIHSGNKFGTGTHPTTQICLAMLEGILIERSSVLDLGTGTGILAICAAKLRARHVVAIDHDFEACQIAMHNIMNNGLHRTVRVINGCLDALSDRARFDIVLANLELHTLIHVIPPLKSHLNPDGVLVTSGVQSVAQTDLSNILVHSGFTTLSSRTEGEWVGCLASPVKGGSLKEMS
jgi:ribosomal protein L11 methyltransferase